MKDAWTPALTADEEMRFQQMPLADLEKIHKASKARGDRTRAELAISGIFAERKAREKAKRLRARSC